MKQTVLILLLICLTGSLTLAQQTSRALTPAEQKQKERVERELQLQREIREEAARKQQEYEAKQAEKERKKAARQAAKDNPASVVDTKPAVRPAAVTKPQSDQVVTETPKAEPVVAQPRQKRVKKEKVRPEPVVTTPTPVVSEPASDRVGQPDAVTEPEAKPARPVRVRKERAVRVKPQKVSPQPTADVVITEPRVVSRPKHEFLPKDHLFDPILLDPLEAQTYGSVLPAYYTEGSKYKGSIVPFAFGFAKPFYRRTTAPDRAEELVLDLASFTQFEVFFDQDKGKQLRRIVNNDYKVSISYNLRRGENNYRIRVYHISSHLGDDYIFRNSIRAPTPNSVNYEQLDVTYSRTVDNWRLYGGLGAVLRKKDERKLLSAQLGAFYKKPSEHLARLVGGLDVKFWQQTDFRPGIHGGIGVEVGRTQNNLTFLLEGYSGFRPYSQFEQQQTSWIGVGVYLNPF